MATFGPKITRRQRNRFASTAGKGYTKKFPDGTVVTFDTDPLMVAVADGLMEMARRIGEEAAAHAADSPTYINESGQRVPQPAAGYGLPSNWGVMGWTFGNLIEARKATGSERLTKPRALKLQRDSVQAIVGFGFPARFNELGTQDQPARPFLGPAGQAFATSGEVQPIMKAALASRGLS
jgi:hypothetical protein